MTVGITELPPEGMQLPGVSLAGDAERGTKTTEGISLLFTTAGITVQGPQPQIERLLVWGALDSATCHELIQLPDGRDAAILELTSGGQSIRFLLPTDQVSPGQAAYLDQALPAWLARYKVVADTAATPPTAGTVTAAASTAAADEVGVTLPAPGPTVPVTTTAPVEDARAPEVGAPTFATAGATAAVAGGLAFQRPTPDAPNGNGSTPSGLSGPGPVDLVGSGAPGAPLAPMPGMQPPAPSAAPAPPAAPAMQAPPPAPPAPAAPAPAPTFQAPPPPPPTVTTHADAMPPVAQPAGVAAPDLLPPTAPTTWDDPPLGGPAAAAVAVEKAPWYKLAPSKSKQAKQPKQPKQPKQAKQSATVEAGLAGAAVGAAAGATATKVPWYKPAPRKSKASAAPEVAAAAAAAPAAEAVVGSPVGQAPSFVAPPAAGKTPWYKLSPSKKQAAGVAAPAAAAGVVAAPAVQPPAPTLTPPTATKTPWYKPAPRKPKKAEVAAAAAGVATVTHAPVTPVESTATMPPPVTTPSEPVPLAVQPPAPATSPFFPAAATPPAPAGPAWSGGATPGGAPGDGGGDVVLAGAGKKSNRTSLLLLVGILVVALVGGGAYVLSKKNSTTSTPPSAPAGPSPASAAAADTALAGAINLRLADLPTGWSAAAPAQAVVRPPVAPAAAQIAASATMGSCLGTSSAVVSGLFGTGSLPGQTSLVQSPTFQSAAGTSFEMGSRTATLTSAGQVQALDALFTNPKFDLCYQQYQTALVTAAVPGSTVQVQPVTLTAPAGVQSYGVVTTYTVPTSGTEVVGDAFLLGGRIVTSLQPTTSGASIPGPVFTPAYAAVAARVARAAA